MKTFARLIIFAFVCLSVPLVLPIQGQSEQASLSGPCLNCQLQHGKFLQWADNMRIKSAGTDNQNSETVSFDEPQYFAVRKKNVVELGTEERQRVADTAELFFKTMGRNSIASFLWTGVEPGNPLTRNEDYRWNFLREAGMYDPLIRRKLIQQMQLLGIRNMRIGLSNHEMDLNDDRTWVKMEEMLRDFSEGGLYLSLDLHHFGIEDRFRVVDALGKTVGEKSYYLNPQWPDYFAAFSEKVVRKYGKYIKAITIMNEPETVVGFNGEMWHGGFPGWSNKDGNLYYIERCLRVGIASVKARLRIEKYLASLPEDVRPHFLYVHTEAAVHKLYWEEFNNFRRFIVSDAILGHESLINGPLDLVEHAPMEEIIKRWETLPATERTDFDWVIQNYLVQDRAPENREQLRRHLIATIKNLRSLHRQLKTDFGKTMRTDTMFAVDYYAHNEDRDKDNVHLDPEPQNYIGQLRAGRRAGLYSVIVDYYNHFKMPMMGGELGTPYYFYGAMWGQQMLLEAAQAAQQGIPFLGYTAYPAIDTWGWESALSVPKEKTLLNPSGIFDFDIRPRPFMAKFIKSLHDYMH